MGTSVDIDTGHTDDEPTQEESVNRYESEQNDPSQGSGTNAPPKNDNSQESDNQSGEQGESTDNSESDNTSERDSSQESEESNKADEPNANIDESSSEEDTDDSESQQPDFSKFFEEYSNYGELSEDSLKELEAEYNIDRETVQDYISSKSQLGQAIQHAVLNYAGGQDQFNNLAEYARNNLPESEVQQFNREVNSGDVNRALDAIRNLKGKFDEAHGSESGDVTEGLSTGTSNVTGYRSQSEMQADMRDERYETDPAFREQVRERIRKSNF